MSVHSARPSKMPGWVVHVRESCPVNKQLIVIDIQICLCSFLNSTLGFLTFRLKNLKNMTFQQACGRKFSCKQ